MRGMPLATEICIALRMAADDHLLRVGHRIVSVSVLRSSYLRRQRLPPRLAHVPQVQRHLLVILVRSRRNVSPGTRRLDFVQRRQDCLRTSPRVQESRYANANARDRQHSIVSLPWHSRLHISRRLVLS